MKPKEELTTKMHGELTVTKAQDRANIAGTAKEMINSGELTEAEARRIYAVTQAELDAA